MRGGRYESIAITKAVGLLPDECAVTMEVVVSRDCNGMNHDTGDLPNFNFNYFRKLGRPKVGLMIMKGFRLITRATERSDCSYRYTMD